MDLGGDVYTYVRHSTARGETVLEKSVNINVNRMVRYVDTIAYGRHKNRKQSNHQPPGVNDGGYEIY